MRRSISTRLPSHIGVDLNIDALGNAEGYDVPLIVNLQPAGEYLGEDYHHRAGGVPTVVNAELIQARPHP